MAMTYIELLKDPRWQRKRLEILQRDEWRCRECGSGEKSLQVHHKHYLRGHAPWEYEPDHLLTLCEGCHKRMSELVGEMSANQLAAIVQSIERFAGSQHGEEFLAVLIHCGSWRDFLVSQPYSTPRSRLVEQIDDLIDRTWALVDVTVRRSNGEV
jgi:hypothetical protein